MKYRLTFLRVLKVFHEPLRESNTKRQVKISDGISKESTFFGEGHFLEGYKCRAQDSPTYENVSICNDYRVGRVKIHQVGTSETVKCVGVQLLIPIIQLLRVIFLLFFCGISACLARI